MSDEYEQVNGVWLPKYVMRNGVWVKREDVPPPTRLVFHESPIWSMPDDVWSIRRAAEMWNDMQEAHIKRSVVAEAEAILKRD